MGLPLSDFRLRSDPPLAESFPSNSNKTDVPFAPKLSWSSTSIYERKSPLPRFSSQSSLFWAS
jgi:hypothetical protein